MGASWKRKYQAHQLIGLHKLTLFHPVYVFYSFNVQKYILGNFWILLRNQSGERECSCGRAIGIPHCSISILLCVLHVLYFLTTSGKYEPQKILKSAYDFHNFSTFNNSTLKSVSFILETVSPEHQCESWDCDLWHFWLVHKGTSYIWNSLTCRSDTSKRREG